MSHGRSIYGNISNQMMIGFIFWGLPFALLCLFVNISIAITTISPSQALRDVNGDTLVSDGESFELGFFSPGSSNKNRYLGIWYKKIPVQTVVWVANRPNPITDSSGVLKVDDKGNLILLNQTDNVIWSSSSSSASHEAQSPVVKLLDTGNLVLLDNKGAGNSEAYLWQSFDYPSDTFLPGMKLGWNLKTGLNRVLTSWKSFDDPSPGELTHGIDPHGYPEAFIWKGTVKIFRSGPWNGFGYSGGPEMRHNTIFNFSFIYNGEEVYSMYQSNDNYKLTRVVLNQTNDNDLLRRYTWVEHTQTWQQLSATLPKDGCDTYGRCGPYGNCDIDKLPICQCLKGFKPKSSSIDGSQGCDHKSPLSCSKKNGFLKFSGLKLPDTTHSWVSKSMSLKECKAECLKNCSCVGYARADIRGAGSGCALWYGDLIDIRQISVSEQDLYVRVAASELESESARKIKKYVLIFANVIICGMLLLGICGWYIRKSKMKPKGDQESNEANDNNNGSHTDDLELPMYDMLIISIATDNFSDSNKLGEGGFGPVYKGKLKEGHEIAVKKLSKYSVQGMHEFHNEVILISKLQHRNLVRLLGCCIQGDEKMLIYEYMPNKSLDSFIFDNTKRKILDWRKRFNIILGVARGLLYLHQDSRLRVIHRDMKASNVLLDSNMDPKISDFGMARIFGGEHFEASTNRVVGTYGYMPPEYLMDGHFSVKSDVFSFGVLVLEIVSGTRNKGFYHSDHQHNLLGHAWKLWIEGKALELIDASISDSCPESDVIRCVHVGLLCVQQRADDRPTMSTVVLMLSSESTMLPKPKQPGFFTERYPMEANSWDTSSKQESANSNNLTITLIEGR